MQRNGKNYFLGWQKNKFITQILFFSLNVQQVNNTA